MFLHPQCPWAHGSSPSCEWGWDSLRFCSVLTCNIRITRELVRAVGWGLTQASWIRIWFWKFPQVICVHTEVWEALIQEISIPTDSDWFKNKHVAQFKPMRCEECFSGSFYSLLWEKLPPLNVVWNVTPRTSTAILFQYKDKAGPETEQTQWSRVYVTALGWCWSLCHLWISNKCLIV